MSPKFRKRMILSMWLLLAVIVGCSTSKSDSTKQFASSSTTPSSPDNEGELTPSPSESTSTTTEENTTSTESTEPTSDTTTSVDDDLPSTYQIVRYYNARNRRHAWSISLDEKSYFNSLGFGVEGSAFETYSESTSDCDVELYRCLRGVDGDFFLGTDPYCDTSAPVKSLGYICKSSQSYATRTLVRFRCGPVYGHFATPDPGEINAYNASPLCVNEGTLGYVP